MKHLVEFKVEDGSTIIIDVKVLEDLLALPAVLKKLPKKRRKPLSRYLASSVARAYIAYSEFIMQIQEFML